MESMPPSRRLDACGPSTILFAPASNVLFHVGRCVVLAREMARRGHRTVLAGTDRYLRDPEVVTTSESQHVPLPDFSPEEGMDLLRSIFQVPRRAQIESFVEAELAVLQEIQPDIVVADFRPTMAISARLCGIPVASLLLSHWLPEYATKPDWVPRTYGIGELIQRLLGERLARLAAGPIFRRVIRYKSAPFRSAALARGLDAPPMLWNFLQGDLNLVTDSDALCPLALAPGCHRVGPILWEPDEPLPAVLQPERLDPTRPVLFVNYGSTAHPDLFRATFEELRDHRSQVVLATCGQIEATDFDVPENFHVAKFLPVGKMIERSDLVVYHGGAGTFQQTLRAGVPGLVVATHWDQEHAGVTSERLGLGAFLTMRQVLRSRGRMRAAVDAILDDLPTHRERAAAMREDLRRYDGPKAAAEHLEAFLAARSRV
jgi:UDP:flavonoid glycosyltransferase YjiC (YdhE family)